MEMEYKAFRAGLKMPVIGLGTWGIGGGYWSPDCSRKKEWVELIKFALELGYRLFDTAEMYGGGCSEEILGEALRGFPRDEVFIITKVWPNHADFDGVVRSALASSRRLGTFIDLYLLHWPSNVAPISETIRAFERLIDDGVIRHMGVSNFDARQLTEAMQTTKKHEITADEVKYNIAERYIERDLSPQSPVSKVLNELTAKYGKTPAQIALSWLIEKPTVVPIPKSTSREHLRENLESINVKLNREDYERLEALR